MLMTLEENLNQPFIGSSRNKYTVVYYGSCALYMNSETYTNLQDAQKNALGYLRNIVPIGTSDCSVAIFKNKDRYSIKAWGKDINGKIFPTSDVYRDEW